MRKVFLLLLAIFTISFTSCEEDCTQEAMCTMISQANSVYSTGVTLVTICHQGQTIQVDQEALQTHLNHGDTEGECAILSDDGLQFRDGEVVEIGCKYELPFIYTQEDGTQWLYTRLNN